MLAIRRRKAAIKIPSEVTRRPSAFTECSQNQRSSGTDVRSAKQIRIRRNHPEKPKARTAPIETKENKNPFTRAMGKISISAEKKTAEADNKKGKKDAHKRLTIDTEPDTVLRIIRRKEGPAA